MNSQFIKVAAEQEEALAEIMKLTAPHAPKTPELILEVWLIAKKALGHE